MRETIFTKLMNNESISMEPDLCIELSDLFFSRADSLDYDILTLFADLGDTVDDIRNILDNPRFKDDEDLRSKLGDMGMEFFFFFAVLIKFLYPMMEQLETAVDKKLDKKCAQ